MAPELESTALEEPVDSQAVKARFNPWWLLGAVLLVLAVVLGVRSVRKSKSARSEEILIEEISIDPGDEPRSV
jgi:hypothetical protein